MFDSAEFRNLAPKEQIKYRNDMTTARDIANQIDYARKEGMEKARIETARNLLKTNLSLEDIAKATGMSLEEVSTLSPASSAN